MLAVSSKRTQHYNASIGDHYRKKHNVEKIPSKTSFANVFPLELGNS
jgi:hypothetical protein